MFRRRFKRPFKSLLKAFKGGPDPPENVHADRRKTFLNDLNWTISASRPPESGTANLSGGHCLILVQIHGVLTLFKSTSFCMETAYKPGHPVLTLTTFVRAIKLSALVASLDVLERLLAVQDLSWRPWCSSSAAPYKEEPSPQT